jgi:DNA invertase Pin-like site-specific DNA recombinase
MLVSPGKLPGEGIIMDIGYARVSTEDQSPELQRQALKRAGCDVIRQERASGKAGANRPVRDAVLKELVAGDTLTVWKLDRIGRSVIELNTIISDLKARGVAFRSLTDPIDTSTANGGLLFQILAAFAEFERAIIIERTRAGKAAMMANGIHPGGTASFGFEADHVTVNDGESALLKEATDRLLVNKHPLSTIVDDWNAREARTRDGGSWHVTSLRRQLMNPRVVAIIGQDDYDALNRLFKAPDRQKKGVPATHLLSGILHCATCSQPMYAKHSRNRDGSELLLYACRATNGGRFKGCGQMSINYTQADAWLRDAFVATVCSPLLPELIAKHSDAGTERLVASLAADRAELEELATLKGEGRFTIPEWLAMRDPIEARIRAAEVTLASSSTDDVAALRSLPRSVQAMTAAWAEWDVPTRRVWLKRLLVQVLVQAGAIRGAPMDERLIPEWRT